MAGVGQGMKLEKREHRLCRFHCCPAWCFLRAGTTGLLFILLGRPALCRKHFVMDVQVGTPLVKTVIASSSRRLKIAEVKIMKNGSAFYRGIRALGLSCAASCCAGEATRPRPNRPPF